MSGATRRDDLLLFKELVINVIANNAGDHTDDKRRDYNRHFYHLLPILINAVVGSGSIGAIILEIFQNFKPDKLAGVFAVDAVNFS